MAGSGICGKFGDMDFLTLALVVLVTPFVSFLLWTGVHWLNRKIQPLIPDGPLKRKLNTQLYKAVGEPRQR